MTSSGFRSEPTLTRSHECWLNDRKGPGGTFKVGVDNRIWYENVFMKPPAKWPFEELPLAGPAIDQQKGQAPRPTTGTFQKCCPIVDPDCRTTMTHPIKRIWIRSPTVEPNPEPLPFTCSTKQSPLGVAPKTQHPTGHGWVTVVQVQSLSWYLWRRYDCWHWQASLGRPSGSRCAVQKPHWIHWGPMFDLYHTISKWPKKPRKIRLRSYSHFISLTDSFGLHKSNTLIHLIKFGVTIPIKKQKPNNK